MAGNEIPRKRMSKIPRQHLIKAAEYEEQGFFDKAIKELEKAITLNPAQPPVLKNLAELYRSQRRMDDAIVVLRNFIEIDEKDSSAREMLLEMLLELGRFDEAIHEAQDLLRVSPRSLSARDVLSIAYLQKGMLEKALQITNELIKMDPYSPINHFKKAVLYQQKGDISNAIHEFIRVLEMNPDVDMAEEAREAIETLDSHQLRHIVMLAVEDYIFRAKLIHDPESAALERGYFLSGGGMSALKQIHFDDLPNVYSEWKQRYYH